MMLIGDVRMMRDGTLVKVVAEVMEYDSYWRREMPYGILDALDGSFTGLKRRQPTVESYPLFEREEEMSEELDRLAEFLDGRIQEMSVRRDNADYSASAMSVNVHAAAVGAYEDVWREMIGTDPPMYEINWANHGELERRR